MTNLIDYMLWRGDVPMTVSPFNEIDNLIFSMTTLLDLNGIVPEDMTANAPFLKDCIAAYEQLHDGSSYLGRIIPEETMEIMRHAAASPRYDEVRITGYRSELDPNVNLQFCGMTFLLPDGTAFVGYRGTDDTIAGWKENLLLCLPDPVLAELSAAKYLSDAAEAFPLPLRVGGHSKGGHLAVRAAASVPQSIRARIQNVYSNDGPGFIPEFFEEEGYRDIRDRTVTYIPQSSLVGALLTQDDERSVIIQSTQIGVMQHDPRSWEVMHTEFVRLPQRSRFARQSDEALDRWIASLNTDERRAIIENIFKLLDSTDAATLTELDADRLHSTKALLRALNHQDRETKRMMLELTARFFRSGTDNSKK